MLSIAPRFEGALENLKSIIEARLHSWRSSVDLDVW
jgi:hypothetical protein